MHLFEIPFDAEQSLDKYIILGWAVGHPEILRGDKDCNLTDYGRLYTIHLLAKIKVKLGCNLIYSFRWSCGYHPSTSIVLSGN